MKIKDVFSLALYNIKRKPKENIQLFIGVLISAIICTGVLSYSFFLDEKISTSVLKNMTECYFTYDICNDEDNYNFIIDDPSVSELGTRMIEYARNTPGISDITVRRHDPFAGTFYTEALAMDGYGVEYADSQLIVDGEAFSYQGDNNHQDNFITSISVAESSIRTSSFSESEKKSFCATTGQDSIYLYGGEFTDVNQIAIASSTLAAYGVPEELYPELIGKEISLLVSDYKSENHAPLIDKFILAAIIDGSYYTNEASITVSTDKIINYMSVSFWPETADEEIVRQLMVDAEEELGVELTASDKLETLFLLNDQKEFTYRILFLVMALIVLAVFTNIVFYLYFSVSQKSFMYAMYMAIGMRKRQLVRLKILETTIVSLAATVIGILVTYGILAITSSAVNEMFIVKLAIQPQSFALASFISFAMITALLAIILMTIMKSVLFLKPVATILKFYKK